MPVLQAFDLSCQFDNGDTLFKHLSCTVNKHRIGLVGSNGVGKSVLASMLTGDRTPSSGRVVTSGSVAMYRQQPSSLLNGTLTIAQFLGLDDVLTALKKIESGDSAQRWFDKVGENWDLPARLARQLSETGLPTDPDFPCAKLSGGQLARLQLWSLFNNKAELLVLDEPSNHLDTAGKQWLIDSIRHFEGALLLVSHDRELLREMEEIWELSGLGLKVYGGNYDLFASQKQVELEAVGRQLASIDKHKRRLQEQAQRNREKAEQRAGQGNRLRKDGSQPKVLLDTKKDKATASASSRNKNEQLRLKHLREKQQALSERKSQLKSQNLYLSDTQSQSRRVISMLNALLPFGIAEPLTLQVFAGNKLHLTGPNGCGKSTLLKSLLGDVSLVSGEMQVNTSLFYLDQHFGVVRAELSALENLMRFCAGMKESDARTMLAGIGFRSDDVFRLGEDLSGGELMKLAMLIASHQQDAPLLLLDEPDNHLDLESKIMLSQALNHYGGGFILISHDHDFAQESGVNCLFDMS